MHKECRHWARSCLSCQRAKVTRHTKAPLHQFPPTTERFSMVHMDLIGPLPPSEDFKYCLTMVDHLTRWPEVVPLKSITAEDVVRAFKDTWISRFGVPKTVVCDQGRQFTSNKFQQFAQLAGIDIHYTNSYHPQANGMVERFHRTLKAALTCHKSPWSMALTPVLLGLRSVLKEDLGGSPAQFVFGEAIRLPGEFFVPPEKEFSPSELFSKLQAHVKQICPMPASHHGVPSCFVHSELATCTHCFLRVDAARPALTQPYTGPHIVLERGAKTFVLEVNGKQKSVSIDRLKPAYVLAAQLPEPAPTAPRLIRLAPRRLPTEPAAEEVEQPDQTPEQPDQTPEQPEMQPALPAQQPALVEQQPMASAPTNQSADQAQQQQPARTTRSGRQVRFPAKY
ncbi:Hypothetical predicted protein [Cloeon dipterum]|uniref:Integrase catalytic domain-containing protein n=1 Tax=Cloeon dipterum TaxID=197152 RepID=A0A8S1E2P8_9INSE|nr:Hypothetical predicted protein [Cloeon dipterum]